GVGVVHAEWLLRKDAANRFSLARSKDQVGLRVGRHSDVEDFDAAIVEKLFVGLNCFGNPMPNGGLARVFGIARGNGDGIEARFAISDQMTIADDESAAKDADARVALFRHGRMNPQIHYLKMR